MYISLANISTWFPVHFHTFESLYVVVGPRNETKMLYNITNMAIKWKQTPWCTRVTFSMYVLTSGSSIQRYRTNKVNCRLNELRVICLPGFNIPLLSRFKHNYFLANSGEWNKPCSSLLPSALSLLFMHDENVCIWCSSGGQTVYTLLHTSIHLSVSIRQFDQICMFFGPEETGAPWWNPRRSDRKGQRLGFGLRSVRHYVKTKNLLTVRRMHHQNKGHQPWLSWCNVNEVSSIFLSTWLFSVSTSCPLANKEYKAVCQEETMNKWITFSEVGSGQHS